VPFVGSIRCSATLLQDLCLATKALLGGKTPTSKHMRIDMSGCSSVKRGGVKASRSEGLTPGALMDVFFNNTCLPRACPRRSSRNSLMTISVFDGEGNGERPPPVIIAFVRTKTLGARVLAARLKSRRESAHSAVIRKDPSVKQWCVSRFNTAPLSVQSPRTSNGARKSNTFFRIPRKMHFRARRPRFRNLELAKAYALVRHPQYWVDRLR